jgi:peptidyl-prolyl cis-trans isomerase A (cyclophilin A)
LFLYDQIEVWQFRSSSFKTEIRSSVWYIAPPKYQTLSPDPLIMLKLSNFKISLLSVAILSLMLMAPLVANAKNVVIATPLGDIEIELLEDAAPKTVANFLRYVETDRYNFSFIHRSAHNPDGSAFILQGGGYKFVAGGPLNIPEYPAVENEFNVSNTRGTLAMAKLGGNPDSATSEWFINLADNSSNLDNQNGGFTVFARVVGNGMAVADAISQLATVNGGGPYTD